MGSKLGVTKIAAGRLGLTLQDYQSKRSQGLKWCWKCEEWKSIDEFTVDRSRGDSLSAACYECRRTDKSKPSKRKRREMLNQGLSWCCNCKHWFPVDKIRGSRCRLCRNAYARERYATDKIYREERRNHSEKHRRGVERVPLIGQEILLEDTNGMCVYCESPATTWDHIIPVSEGGRTTPGNIVPCCRPCNSSKKSKDVFEWMDEKGIEPSPVLYERIELSVME